MRQEKYSRLRLPAALVLLAVMVIGTGGCGSRYEAIELGETMYVNEPSREDVQMTLADSVPDGVDQKDGRDNLAEADDAEDGLGNLAETDGAGGDSGRGALSEEIREQEVPLSTKTAIVMESVDEVVYVTGDQVNLRAAAGMSGAVLAHVDAGTELHRTGYHEEWSRVEYQGQVCFIASRYVSVEKTVVVERAAAAQETEAVGVENAAQETEAAQTENTVQETAPAQASASDVSGGEVKLDSAWKYAEFSKINTGAAKLYRSESANRNNITICVNAGHGTSGGSSVKTLCHPDGTAKVTGGTTGAGATTAAAVSGGMTFSDGTPEAKVTLAMAKLLKEKLLTAGYDVLMIRENDDVQLDNVARTVIANNRADCHIALHWDSTTSDKGAFYMSVPNVESYRNMEPVKSNWQNHNTLGESLVEGLRQAGVKIFSGGAMEMDLTQTSYSTVPSVDIELGDKASDHSDAALKQLADGLLIGVNQYFGQ